MKQKNSNLETETNYEKEEIILGIDEAGRGPVLGPMVYACAFWSESSQDEILKELKFADSKQLKESVRESIYDRMVQVKGKILE